MVRYDAWSTDEEIAERAKNPREPYRLSSDALLWGIIVGLCFIASLGAVVIHDLGVQVNRLQQINCQEDMACWNCHTMGNKICGPAWND